jgi:hypothetical protein
MIFLKVSSLCYSGEPEETYKIACKIADNPAGIRTKYFPVTDVDCCGTPALTLQFSETE